MSGIDVKPEVLSRLSWWRNSTSGRRIFRVNAGLARRRWSCRDLEFAICFRFVDDVTRWRRWSGGCCVVCAVSEGAWLHAAHRPEFYRRYEERFR